MCGKPEEDDMDLGDRRYWSGHNTEVEVRAKLVTKGDTDDFYVVISYDGEYHIVPDYDLWPLGDKE